MRIFTILPLMIAAPLWGQSPPEVTFVTRLGRDTVAVERFLRTESEVRGRLITLLPTVRTTEYQLRLTPAGTVVSGEVGVRSGAGGEGSTVLSVMKFSRADTLVTVVATRGGRTDTIRVAARAGAVPMITGSIVPYEQMTMQAAKVGGDSVAIDQYQLGASQATPNAVVRRTSDSVSVRYFGDPHYLRVDDQGRVLGLNGIRTTAQYLGERVDRLLDLESIAMAAVTRATPGAAGGLSPRDTVLVTLAGGGEIWLDYGRPAARGREILGNVVPFGKVWRLGANAATQFRTNRDLEVGNVRIPAGTFTLFSLPDTNKVELIVNRQTGQWGTDHDPSRDLVRIPVEVLNQRTPVERFTMTVEPRDGGGVLVMSWHTFVWRVPFVFR